MFSNLRDDRLTGRQQMFERVDSYRFGEMVVETGRYRQALVFIPAIASHCNHASRIIFGVGTQGTGDIIPVRSGQADIADHNLRSLTTGLFDAFVAGMSNRYEMPG